VAITLQATGHTNAVRPRGKSVEDMFFAHPARTRNLDDADVGLILQPDGPAKVGRGIGAVMAAKSYNLRLKGSTTLPSPFFQLLKTSFYR
jgi:hypothetical protein